MGKIWDSICKGAQEVGRGVRNVARTGARVIGIGIEKLGEITHIDAIEDFGIQLQLNNPYIEKPIDVDDDGSSVEDIIAINKMIEDTREEAEEKAFPIESRMVNELRHNVNQFIDALSEVLDEGFVMELGYSIETDFQDSIHGTFSEYISDKVSLNSEAYKELLKMDDSERQRASKDYLDKCVEEGIAILKRKCLEEQTDIYRKMLTDLKEFFAEKRELATELKEISIDLAKHMDEAEYITNEGRRTAIQLAYWESVKTLTYSQ